MADSEETLARATSKLAEAGGGTPAPSGSAAAEAEAYSNRQKLYAILDGGPSGRASGYLSAPPKGEAIATLDTKPSRFTITPGLHVVSGATGSGKTTLMYTLHLLLTKAKAGQSKYVYAGEPGHTSFRPALPTLAPEWLRSAANQGAKIVIFDSLTYFMGPIGSSLVYGMELDNVTYEKGLRLTDLYTIRYLDCLARSYGIALYGVLNADLFPRTTALEGACEGIVQVRSYQSMSFRNRLSRREELVSFGGAAASVVSAIYGKPESQPKIF